MLQNVSSDHMKPTTVADEAVSSQLMHAVFGSLSTGVCITNGMGVLVEVNQAFSDMIGYPKDEIVGKNFIELLKPFTNNHGVTLTHVINSDLPIEGHEMPIALSTLNALSISAKWWQEQPPHSARYKIIFLQDITEKRITEARLKEAYQIMVEKERTLKLLHESIERFEKVAEATSDAVWDWNILGEDLYLGRGFTTIFGHPCDKETSRDTWFKHVHPDDLQGVIDETQRVLADPQLTHFLKEYRYQHADGRYFHVVGRGIVIRNEEGNPIRMVGVMSDISHHHAYQESLKQLNIKLERRAKELATSNAELEQFAYVASHDLQEPLRMVTSFLTQLEKKYKDSLDEKALKYIHFAVDGGKRMRQIILDLLDFSRVGKYSLDDLKLVDINHVIDEIVLLQQRSISEHNVTILKKDLPAISCYQAPLLRIFQNLISNAIKYKKADVAPVITISCESKETVWQFSVADNGIGINPEYFDKIFILFQRLQNDQGGTGMGLAIVKKIIETLQGQIWVESTEGNGCTFYFTIPKTKNQTLTDTTTNT